MCESIFKEGVGQISGCTGRSTAARIERMVTLALQRHQFLPKPATLRTKTLRTKGMRRLAAFNPAMLTRTYSPCGGLPSGARKVDTLTRATHSRLLHWLLYTMVLIKRTSPSVLLLRARLTLVPGTAELSHGHRYHSANSEESARRRRNE